MDAREQLRRYLEQRKESGEKELVLDNLGVDELMSLLAKGPSGAKSADWRDVLRDAGAAPTAGGVRESGKAVQPMREPPQPGQLEPRAERPAEPLDVASEQPPAGLTVGDGRGIALPPEFARLDDLSAVAGAVAKCTRCPLYATAKNPVPGSGRSDADLMIVGEAPGANEDEQGLPFVGAAGQLLTKILGAISLERDDVFICNVLKHRPPGNRNPMPDEVAACSPYLFRQFQLVQPKAILALGTFAAQTLLQTKLAIGKLRGQVHRFHGVPLIVTYHPAALLRNPSWKRPTWEDVQLVRRILDSAVA